MITLNDAKQLSQDKLTDIVIDEFAKSPLLATLPFDNTVKAQGGRSLTYAYNRVTTQPTAATRALGAEYTPQEAKTTKQNVDLKVMGGSYKIDRAIQENETQVVNEVEFQSTQKAKATVAVFHDQLINGDSAQNASDFDGIDKVVTGSTTEFIPATAIDLSSNAAIESNYKDFLYYLRKATGAMDGEATHILLNADMYAIFQSIADRVPSIKYDRDEMGNEVYKYGNAVIAKMGDKAGSSDPIIGIDSAKGTTSIYVIREGLDGVHGVSPDGTNLINVYTPDFTQPGAVKTGEVEFVGAVVVKSTKSVAVIRNIKVVATA